MPEPTTWMIITGGTIAAYIIAASTYAKRQALRRLTPSQAAREEIITARALPAQVITPADRDERARMLEAQIIGLERILKVEREAHKAERQRLEREVERANLECVRVAKDAETEIARLTAAMTALAAVPQQKPDGPHDKQTD